MLEIVKQINLQLSSGQNTMVLPGSSGKLRNINFNKLKLAIKGFPNFAKKLFPPFLADIFYWNSPHHKTPLSKIIANSRYEKFRGLFDVYASKKVLDSLNGSYASEFEKGYTEIFLDDLSSLDHIFLKTYQNAKPRHAGARPFFKDKEKKLISDSYSAYFDVDNNDSKKIEEFIRSKVMNIDELVSVFAGYPAKFKNISFALAIVSGQNSNSEMHQDTWSGIAKGFIYLSDVDSTCSPFEYCEASYQDIEYRSSITNNAVLSGDNKYSPSTRLRGEDLSNALKRFKLKTFEAKSGTMILANTSGYHRKGHHSSLKPRVTLVFQLPRKTSLMKFVLNFLSPNTK